MNFTCDRIEEVTLENGGFIVTLFITSCFILFFTGMNQVAGPPPDDIVSYETKYYDAYIKLPEDSSMNISLLEHAYIKDITDDDETIIMCYSSEYEVFHYWGDPNLSFATLNSLAQLYAIENNCKSICIDYYEEIAKATNKINQYKHEEKKKMPESLPSDSPFASFKTYNMKTNRATKNSNSIVPEKSNHFRRKGSLADWDVSNGKWVHSINNETSKNWIIVPEENDATQTYSYSYNEWKSNQ
jgi:hypothetical protein